MYSEDIFTAASAICGEKSELLGLLCTAAEEELLYRLRKDVDVKSIESLFIASAAMLAASMYIGARPESGVKAYTAGAVSVSYSEGDCADAEALRTRGLMILSDYITDSGFEFVGVTG